jgi:NADH-quinone oxidoreductase subunit E
LKTHAAAHGSPDGSSVSFQPSEAAEEALSRIVARYPEKKSAIMPALYLVQEQLGWIPESGLSWVAARLELPVAHVKEVVSFYTMYHRRPVGAYHVQVCRTLSCMLCGARDLVDYLKQRLGTAPFELTGDGLWSYEEVECLGSCGTGAMVQINDTFFEKLTPAALGELMDRIESERPSLRFSTVHEHIESPLPNAPLSALEPN